MSNNTEWTEFWKEFDPSGKGLKIHRGYIQENVIDFK